MNKSRTMQVLACAGVISVIFGGCIELSTTDPSSASGGAGAGGGNPSCTDDVKNGTETDINCGGSNCPPCSAGRSCRINMDCMSGDCNNERCVSLSCSDGKKEGTETDIDCGGSECPKCSLGKQCSSWGDCLSGFCASGVCTASSCNDGATNGSETDVDCGGADCDPCASGFKCMVSADCTSNMCSNGVCGDKLIVVGATITPANMPMFSINTPAGATMGDILVLFVAHGGDLNSVSAPTGWTELENGASPSQDPKLDVFYRSHDGSASYTFPKDASDGSAILAAFRGVTYGIKGTADNDTSVNLAFGKTSTVLFVSMTNFGADSPARPSGFKNLALGNMNGRSIRVSYSDPTPGGMYTFTAVPNAGDDIPTGTFGMTLH